MGFYMRKSISFGGVRFNFSKSGIGASVGVKGFRFGTGPKGNYIHMGRNGIYYRAAMGQKKNNSKIKNNSQPHPLSQQPQHADDQLLFHEIESGDVSLIVDASSQDLIDEVNQKMKKLPTWPLALLLAFIPVVGPYIAVIAAILIYFVVDKTRKTTFLFYDIEEQTEHKIQQFYFAFEELMNCCAKWHVSAQAQVQDRKYHAGASSVVKRLPIIIKYKTPPKIKTNVQVPCIPVGRQALYFLPDRVLIYEVRRVGGLSYSNLKVSQNNQRFIESDTVPKDGTVVDHTWRYVNKSGGPDKRFKDNRQLPIMLYSDIQFTSTTGLNELVEFSKTDIGKSLNDVLISYSAQGFLAEAHEEVPVAT